MDKYETLTILAALGQETRLDAFRLLVQVAPEPVSAGEIGRRLNVVQNTMSSHLGCLARAGLIRAKRRGRTIEYSAEYRNIRGFLAFLLQDCCQGKPDICSPLIELMENAS